MKYLEVFDINLVRVAVLSNAYNVRETIPLNGVPSLTFSVPEDDNRVEELQKRRFVRWDHGEMYRILDLEDTDDGVLVRNVTCEGAIATLADDVMFQDHIVDSSNTTPDAIRYILSRQTVNRWQLAGCDFDYRYEYGWSSENLFNALLSVPAPFTVPYRIVTDTSGYPWKLSLRRIPTEPTFYVFERLNFLSTRKKEESSQLFTRLYGLGTGEGVNQVTIADANGGQLYVDAPQRYIDQYGLISGVYTAREYDSPEKLKAILDAMIQQTCEPQVTYEVSAVDLHELGTGSLLTAEAGDCIRLADGVTTYITQTARSYDRPGDMTLTLSNKARDLANDLADLADRQRIEMTYSQGATQLWSNTTSDNASPTNGHTHPIWMPRTAKIINEVNIKIELDKFRAYSKTTSQSSESTETSTSGGASTTTSESGGQSTQTSSSSGASTYTSESGGSSTVTSADGGGLSKSDTGKGVFDNAQVISGGPNNANTTYVGYAAAEKPPYTSHTHTIGSHTHNVGYHQHTHKFDVPEHSHQVTLPGHKHQVKVGNHSHTVTLPAHTHSVRIPAHTHNVRIPGHRHDIQYGIFTASEAPSSAQVYVNGTLAFSMGTSWEGDITQYLIGSSGKIPRGTFIRIRVVPDTLAKITVSSATQAFIQSKTGGKY